MCAPKAAHHFGFPPRGKPKVGGWGTSCSSKKTWWFIYLTCNILNTQVLHSLFLDFSACPRWRTHSGSTFYIPCQECLPVFFPRWTRWGKCDDHDRGGGGAGRRGGGGGGSAMRYMLWECIYWGCKWTVFYIILSTLLLFIVFQTKWAATLQQKWHSLVGSNMSRQCLRLAASHLLSSILRWDLECRRFYAMNNCKHWIIFQELLSDIDIWRIQQRRRRRRTVPNRQVCLSCHFSGWVKLCDILSWGEEQGDLKWCSSGCETLCWENVSTISLFTLNGGIDWLRYHFYR